MSYNVRDISWLSFNARVLQEAENTERSLLDRLRFLGIFSNNNDEFYRVRVATLKRMSAMDESETQMLDFSPLQTLGGVRRISLTQRQDFNRCYQNILEEMRSKKVEILNEKQLNEVQQNFVTRYFNTSVRTTIVPIMLESVPTMPVLRDDSIYLACVLNNAEMPIMQRYALIEIPTDRLSRFLILPSEPFQKRVMLLEDVIRYNLPKIFEHFGYDRYSSYLIKLTRDAEMDLREEADEDYTSTLRKALKSRKKGKAVRFLYDKDIDGGLLTYLIKKLDIKTEDDIVGGGRIHNFKDFIHFPAQVFRKAKDPEIKPFIHPKLKQPRRIMKVLDTEDVMLHFPYHSFDSIIDLLREAAIDPQVENIYLTAYRLAKNSKVVHALISAAVNGKNVVVVLELQARFDENNNLEWKNYLEENGVKVHLGVPKMKVHAKLGLITKTNEGQSIQYAFVSTGNFNESTADLYADHCLLTSDKSITREVASVFDYLQNPKEPLKNTHQLINSPAQTRDFFLTKMQKYAELHSADQPSQVYIKLNSLVDKTLISSIYDLHRKGVDISLNIRGICCAKTQEVEGFTEDLPAISIVDNLLEHARVFYFKNKKKEELYISSADWMVRNLDHRIETTCPIKSPDIREEIMHLYTLQSRDNVKARILDDQQSNHFVKSKKRKIRSQWEIYKYLKNKTY